MARDCPSQRAGLARVPPRGRGGHDRGRGRHQQQPRQQGHAYAALAAQPFLEGTIYAVDSTFRILFDTGSSHSFISRQYVVESQLPIDALERPITVVTPLGGSDTLRFCVR